MAILGLPAHSGEGLVRPGRAASAWHLCRYEWRDAPAGDTTASAALLAAWRPLGWFVGFFIAAECEELGWSGYALQPLQAWWSALGAGILLGIAWAAFHLVPLVQGHRSRAWIAWWSLATVALRVLLVWLYNNTGQSVFAATLYHAISNVSTVLFIDYFNPLITGLIVASRCRNRDILVGTKDPGPISICPIQC